MNGLLFAILLGTQSPEEPSRFITAGELQKKLSSEAPPQLLDVRLGEDFDEDPSLIPFATWRDPETIDAWSFDLSRGREVVVYCLRGREVSRRVTARLAELGFRATNLKGGILAWKETGAEVVSGKR